MKKLIRFYVEEETLRKLKDMAEEYGVPTHQALKCCIESGLKEMVDAENPIRLDIDERTLGRAEKIAKEYGAPMQQVLKVCVKLGLDILA